MSNKFYGFKSESDIDRSLSSTRAVEGNSGPNLTNVGGKGGYLVAKVTSVVSEAASASGEIEIKATEIFIEEAVGGALSYPIAESPRKWDTNHPDILTDVDITENLRILMGSAIPEVGDVIFPFFRDAPFGQTSNGQWFFTYYGKAAPVEITEPLRCRFLLKPHYKYTLLTDENPSVIAGDDIVDEFEIIEGTIKLPHADLTYGEFMTVDPIPTDGVPTFVYIKIDDWCSTSPLGNLIMFDTEKTESEMKTDLNDNDVWWIKLAKIELVAPEASSSDDQYTNNMPAAGMTGAVPTSWNHWYIQPYELPSSVPEGRRIQTGEGASSPTWFAKATASGSGDFSGDIYGNGPDAPSTITGVTIKNPTSVEVESGDLLSVLEYCGDFFLTKKGAGGATGEAGACIDIVFDTPLLLAKTMIGSHVVLRGHTEPNDYNMIPFTLDGTSALINELAICRRNENPAFDDMLPETLTGNPEYLDNEFCVVVKSSSTDTCGGGFGMDGDLSGLTGCCTGQPGETPNEWIIAVEQACPEGGA